MNFGIEFLNPWYYGLFATILIVIVSYFAYFFGQKNPIPKTWRFVLFFIRMVIFLLVIFLLMRPVLKISRINIEKPIIPVFIDNSQSNRLFYSLDSLTKNIEIFQDSLEKISPDIHYDFYRFGQDVSANKALDFSESNTDLSKIFSFVSNNYSGQNLAGITIISDGNFNTGSNPVYQSEKASVPLYIIGLGDASIAKDIRLEKIINNPTSYKNAITEIKVKIFANRLNGGLTKLNIHSNGQVLYSEPIKINSNNFFIEKTINLELKQTGINILDFSVNTINGEKNTKNNKQTIAINVIDKKTKWLILGSSPHPDIAALHRSLSRNLNFDVESDVIKKFAKHQVSDVLVLHQLPDFSESWKQFSAKYKLAEIPKLIIIGKNTNISLLNSYHWGQQTKIINKQLDFSNAVLNSKQSRFTIGTEFENLIKDQKPINTLYAKYTLYPNSNVLFTRVFKGIETYEPLLVEIESKHNIFLNATGIWRWSVGDFQDNGTQANFDDFSNQIAALLVKNKVKGARLEYKSLLERGEDIIFNFYPKDSLLLKGNPKIKLNDKIYSFKKTNKKSYQVDLNLDTLGVFDFLFEAIYKNGKKFREESKIYIIPNTREFIKSNADFLTLQQMAHRSNGSFMTWEQRMQVNNRIHSESNLKNIMSSEIKMDDFIHYKWLFFVLLFLFTLEWILRKYINLD